MARRYANRREAGRALAEVLRAAGTRGDVVLALPRGGLPVGLEVAHLLDLPLDVYPIRKLGMPGQEELAIGALAPGSPPVLNEALVHTSGITRQEIEGIVMEESRELDRQERLYRQGRPRALVAGRVVILCDDGLATGYTMRAAVEALRRTGAARIVVAVPVGPPETCRELAAEADEFICPLQPEEFLAVGEWYEQFGPTSDAEVQACLARSRPPISAPGSP